MNQCLELTDPQDSLYLRDIKHRNGPQRRLMVFDYYFLVLSLIIPAVMGLYHSTRRSKIRAFDDYVLANHSMAFLPVGLSLMASFTSSISMLGMPAEIYLKDTMSSWMGMSFLIVSPVSAHIYMPVFYQLRITTVFKYLEMRFSRVVRMTAAFLFIMEMVFYMAIMLYVPNIAFHEVTQLNLWGPILAIGFVCILYVALGGLKAIIYTDSLQLIVMFLGTALLLYKSAENVGTRNMWEAMQRTNRLHFFDFRVDPTLPHTTWTEFLGSAITFISVYAANQASVQRCLACRTLEDAKLALWLQFPLHLVFLILTCAVGLYMAAFYETCDPLESKVVGDKAEMIPLFMTDMFSGTLGMSGLYMAGVFSATLSTMSSGMNSVAIVILEDFVRVVWRTRLNKKGELLLLQFISILLGIFCLHLAYYGSKLEDIQEAMYFLFAVCGCSILGLFSLGMFFPWTNETGAFIGGTSSIFFTLFLAVSLPRTPSALYGTALRCVTGCSLDAFSNNTADCAYNCSLEEEECVKHCGRDLDGLANTSNSKLIGLHNFHKDPNTWYAVSGDWYPSITFFSCIAIGLLASYITGFRDPKDVDPRLIVPLLDEVFPFYYLPESTREYFRFGIEHKDKFSKASSQNESVPEVVISASVSDSFQQRLSRQKDRNVKFLMSKSSSSKLQLDEQA